MKKILLIAPDFDCDFLPRKSEIIKLPSLSEKKSFLAPLHLATIAALTPDDVEVDFWDESVHGRIDDSTEFPDYHLVGLTGYLFYFQRAKEIAQLFRRRGIPVVVGGYGVSSELKLYRDDFDVLFIGEAELTWPQFIADWKKGDFKIDNPLPPFLRGKEYRQVTELDLALSPVPRWDVVADRMKNYLLGGVQTSRGCSFNCDSCDVPYLKVCAPFVFGRRIRNKPIDNVLKEICVLERMNMPGIFFCDDNFIGNPRYAKDLLKELIPLNRSFSRPLAFQTQMSINVAKDDELLELLADANFTVAFIGIELSNGGDASETTPSTKESLQKPQNYRADLLYDIKKVQSYGIRVRASMVVGLDSDDNSIFDQQFSFLQEACTPNPSTYLLKVAPSKSLWSKRLWTRLHKEKRLIAMDYVSNLKIPRTATNIIPKRMTRIELMEGCCNLLQRLHDWDNFAERVKGFVSQVKRKPLLTPEKKLKENVRDELQQLFFLSEDEKVRRAVLDIIQYTLQNAPFMLKQVIGSILQQYNEVVLTQSICEELRRQIELEQSGEITIEIDQTDNLVPGGIKQKGDSIYV